MTPQVSVLMPCYNAEATVDAAVESILTQSLKDLELIAVDDGSSDGTAGRLEAWAARDTRLGVVRLAHAGLVEALNAGWKACRADVIARHDADDLAHTDRLQAQWDRLAAEPDLAAVSCLVEGFPPGEIREGFRIYIEWLNGLTTPEAIAREIFVESPLVHPSVMVRRGWLDRLGGYQDHGWPEDYDLWLRMHLAGARFAKVERPLMAWRDHPARATRTDSRYSVENFLRAKAHYLMQGPLRQAPGVIVWGAGAIGRRLSKHLVREGAPLLAFIDIDPEKIGRSRRGKPIHAPDDLPELLRAAPGTVVLAAVGARGAREIIRNRLEGMDLAEGRDWWAVA